MSVSHRSYGSSDAPSFACAKSQESNLVITWPGYKLTSSILPSVCAVHGRRWALPPRHAHHRPVPRRRGHHSWQLLLLLLLLRGLRRPVVCPQRHPRNHRLAMLHRHHAPAAAAALHGRAALHGSRPGAVHAARAHTAWAAGRSHVWGRVEGRHCAAQRPALQNAQCECQGRS